MSIRRILSPELLVALAFATYRYRYLFTYVVIGGLSLVLELVAFRGLEELGVQSTVAAFLGVLTSILSAYWGNVRFNFKVPVAKRQRALGYFAGISVMSWAVQFVLRRPLTDGGLSYEQARFLISGAAFGLAYVLHRRFSFADYKKVGVAVYAHGFEDIKSIHSRIENYPDIIHVDVVDHTYGREDHDVRTYRLEAVRAYWPHKPIHVHVMSRTPSKYFQDLLPHVDRIYVHAEIDEDIGAALAAVWAGGREAGLAVSLATPLDVVRPHVDNISGVLILAVAQPGRSGQEFQMAALERVAELNTWPQRGHIDVCVDGGVTERNVGLINVEIVVSGSSVLGHPNPGRQIMRLQTSANYEQV